MKIQCNVCEAAEAMVVCCADEAALCWSCDEKVHAANKLAGKHQRVPLSSSSSSSQLPKCDICQENAGFFFCLEDRALLCRKCDLSIHTVNSHVSGHQRFLLTGAKVGLEPAELGASSSSGKSPSGENNSERGSFSASKRSNPTSLSSSRNMPTPPTSACPQNLPTRSGGVGDFSSAKLQVSGGSAATSIAQWQIDQFLDPSDFNHGYVYMENRSSKADSGKHGDSDSSAMLRSSGEDVDDDNECLGMVPDSSWAVSQLPSPPTDSGLFWPRKLHYHSDRTVCVPDICSCVPIHNQHQHNSNVPKRRRDS